MDSKKIKRKDFLQQNHHCIAAIVALPENNKLRLYVAWENRAAAEDGFMGFFKSRELYPAITPEAITENDGLRNGHWTLSGTQEDIQITFLICR